MALQSENAHIIAQNAQKQCASFSNSRNASQHFLRSLLSSESACALLRFSVNVSPEASNARNRCKASVPDASLPPFDEFHGLVKQRIRHFPLSLGKSGGDHKRHKHSGRQPEPCPTHCPERCFPHHSH